MIDRHVNRDVEPKAPIKIDLRELTAAQAKQAIMPWIESLEFKKAKMTLFGSNSPKSWTVSIMSALKPKVHEIERGRLRWVLCTALPLRPDFGIWLNGEKLESSKASKDLIKRWIIGKDMVDLPGLKDITKSDDKNFSESSGCRFGIDVPVLGRVTGYAEAYKDLLTGGKSDKFGRSHGFFVYVYGRLVNVDDGHFGTSPNELRHGTFGRFRLVANMNGLDDKLRSNRETIGEGPLLETARNVLRAIFNTVRREITAYDSDEEPGAKLSRKLAASPASLTRGPIVALSRAVVEGRTKARYLVVPSHLTNKEQEEFLADLDQRADEAEQFVIGVEVSFDGLSHDGIVKFDTASGILWLNGLHPFVATFHDEFTNKKSGQPLELFAMAEVLAEAHLYSIGVTANEIDEFLSTRDQILRDLASKSGRQSALSVANELSDARNNSIRLEERVCDAFRILGFDVRHIGKSNEPDGVAIANLPADDGGNPRSYRVSLEAKSTENDNKKVSAHTVDISAVIRHRDKHNCDHAIAIGPAFSTSDGDHSALGMSIDDDRRKTQAKGKELTITLITVDVLAQLVRLRPVKQVGLSKIRELFECKLPDQSAAWVESIRQIPVAKPKYRKIVETIELLQKKFVKIQVKHSTLQNELSHLQPPIMYETDDKVKEVCEMLALLAPNSIRVTKEKVELEQNANNVIADIEAAMQEYQTDGR